MSGLYIHIPYCRSKCAYCDFFSTPVHGDMERYVKAVARELELRRGEITEPFTTMYLGGGTPSMLPASLLTELFARIGGMVELRHMEEVTIEANPEDVTPEALELYAGIGINRVSIGVQSFRNQELKAISRQHSAEESLRALQVLHDAGINYNADLIYGLPGQTLEDWADNLNRLLAFRPPHFSAYLLSYEPGTKLYAQLVTGKVQETDEIEAQRMYDILCRCVADAGYVHYEVSNFSLPGRHARHNSAYWNYTPYLGLGVAAHSFDGCVRRYNPMKIGDYISRMECRELVAVIEDETDVNRFNDYIVTSMRTARGVDSDFAERTFSVDLVNRFKENVSHVVPGGLDSDGKFYRIPEHRWLTSDAVLRDLILDAD